MPQYSPSSTLVQTDYPFNLHYLSGGVSGLIGSEIVSVGQFQITSQVFAAVDKTNGLGLEATRTSGILGLCFPAVAAIPATNGKTVFENLMSACPPSQRYIGFHLPRMSGSTDPKSSFTICGLDSDLVTEPTSIMYFAVVLTGREYDYWKLPILRITVNGQVLSLSRSRVPGAATPIAVLDTGTTLILGSTYDVAALYALLSCGVRNDPVNGYQIRCTCAVLISLVLGDPAREYFLHPADVSWAEGATSDGWCTGGIQANDNVNSGDWLLGDVFLRNVYVVHKAGDSSSPPMIGLYNLTDPEAAMKEFRADRGPDVDGDGKDDADLIPVGGDDGWDTATGYVKRWEQHASGTAVPVFGAVAGGIGFVVGGISVASWRFWRGV